MKKSILFLIIVTTFFLPNFVLSHVKHYSNLKYLEYEIYLNSELIGTHVFNFKKDKNTLSVNTLGKFKVKKLGIDLMDYKTKTKEIYINGQLNNYFSETFQNAKRKYVNLSYNKARKLFEIDGSSFKGSTDDNSIVGSWWNHEIINKETQISAVSGRVLPQKVKFLGKKELILFDKKYKALKFHFLSNNNKPKNKKKINFNVWYDEKTLLWLKMSYEKMGKWEYRLKKHTFY
ncbi:hypothetical protein OAZ96_02120 [Pelagibacteraceae bacterium]|nr:hypothetical protein [Pelagibacteraceae bacterium]